MRTSTNAYSRVVGRQLRQIRQAQGLTIEELARRAQELGLSEINASLITDIELGRKASVPWISGCASRLPWTSRRSICSFRSTVPRSVGWARTGGIRRSDPTVGSGCRASRLHKLPHLLHPGARRAVGSVYRQAMATAETTIQQPAPETAPDQSVSGEEPSTAPRRRRTRSTKKENSSGT